MSVLPDPNSLDGAQQHIVRIISIELEHADCHDVPGIKCFHSWQDARLLRESLVYLIADRIEHQYRQRGIVSFPREGRMAQDTLHSAADIRK